MKQNLLIFTVLIHLSGVSLRKEILNRVSVIYFNSTRVVVVINPLIGNQHQVTNQNIQRSIKRIP